MMRELDDVDSHILVLPGIFRSHPANAIIILTDTR